MKHQSGKHQSGKNQSGTALVIALILTVVSTLVGISAMESSGIEIQLVNNDLYREVSFRAAESASERLLTNDNITNLANGTANDVSSTFSVNDKITVQATLSNSGTGTARGYSLGVDTAGFQMYKFRSQAKATIDSANTQRVVLQGSERLAPSL